MQSRLEKQAFQDESAHLRFNCIKYKRNNDALQSRLEKQAFQVILSKKENSVSYNKSKKYALQSRLEKQAFQVIQSIYEVMCEEIWRIINVLVSCNPA